MAKENLRPDHPLLTLQGRCVKEYALEIEAWPGRFVGQAGFVLYLRDAGGEVSDRPVVEGVYGRTKIPGSREEVERGILDVRLTPLAEFGARRVGLDGGEMERPPTAEYKSL